MKILNSISNPDRIFETAGNQPILILCDDFNHYVCKYNRWTGQKAGKLIREYIAGSFAKQWALAIPDFQLVNIRKAHIENEKLLQPAFFNTLCFGSKYSKEYAEIDNFYSEIDSSEKSRFLLRNEFLKIALFDIWMGNEDRNHNNYNLLIDIENQNRFVPIDHDAVFNSGTLENGLALITEDESLIFCDITHKLFSKKLVSERAFIDSLKDDFYLCISKCNENVQQILDEIPAEWNLNVHETALLLSTHLFSDKWCTESFEHFCKLLQLRFSS